MGGRYVGKGIGSGFIVVGAFVFTGFDNIDHFCGFCTGDCFVRAEGAVGITLDNAESVNQIHLILSVDARVVSENGGAPAIIVNAKAITTVSARTFFKVRILSFLLVNFGYKPLY